MKLRNIEKDIFFEMEFVGYENTTEDWLLLKIIVKHKNLIFEKIDPALTLKELKRLVDWFKCLSEAKLPSWAVISFIEPCISFKFNSYRNGIVQFIIYLSHELRPPFKTSIIDIDSEDFFIHFNQTNSELKIIAEDLEKIYLNLEKGLGNRKSLF